MCHDRSTGLGIGGTGQGEGYPGGILHLEAGSLWACKAREEARPKTTRCGCLVFYALYHDVIWIYVFLPTLGQALLGTWLMRAIERTGNFGMAAGRVKESFVSRYRMGAAGPPRYDWVGPAFWEGGASPAMRKQVALGPHPGWEQGGYYRDLNWYWA